MTEGYDCIEDGKGGGRDLEGTGNRGLTTPRTFERFNSLDLTSFEDAKRSVP